MALPSTGVTMGAVARTIGYYAFPLYLSLLCKHVNINKWSKWKPFSTTASTLSDSVIKSNNYGFTNITSTNINTIAGWVSANTTYSILQPTGTQNSPYRLGDFRNYNHSAPVPYSYTLRKSEGYRNRYFIQANLNSGAEFNLNDLFPVSANTSASLVLIDKSRKPYSLPNVYTLQVSAVTNNAYVLSGNFDISTTADTSQYYHDCQMALKKGSSYYLIPSESFVFWEPLTSPLISLDNGGTWIDMSGATGEITILQGNGNYKTIMIKTGFPLDVYGGADWLHCSTSQIPASKTNPVEAYTFEIICDTATADRTGYFTFSSSDYAFGYTLAVKQSVTKPNVTITCLQYGQTTMNNRFGVFKIVNTSEVVGANATFYFRYTLASGAEYTTSKYCEIPNYQAGLDGINMDVQFPSVDGTAITSVKFLNTADNVGTITFVSNSYMDGNGNIIIS